MGWAARDTSNMLNKQRQVFSCLAQVVAHPRAADQELCNGISGKGHWGKTRMVLKWCISASVCNCRICSTETSSKARHVKELRRFDNRLPCKFLYMLTVEDAMKRKQIHRTLLDGTRQDADSMWCFLPLLIGRPLSETVTSSHDQNILGQNVLRKQAEMRYSA